MQDRIQLDVTRISKSMRGCLIALTVFEILLGIAAFFFNPFALIGTAVVLVVIVFGFIGVTSKSRGWLNAYAILMTLVVLATIVLLAFALFFALHSFHWHFNWDSSSSSAPFVPSSSQMSSSNPWWSSSSQQVSSSSRPWWWSSSSSQVSSSSRPWWWSSSSSQQASSWYWGTSSSSSSKFDSTGSNSWYWTDAVKEEGKLEHRFFTSSDSYHRFDGLLIAFIVVGCVALAIRLVAFILQIVTIVKAIQLQGRLRMVPLYSGIPQGGSFLPPPPPAYLPPIPPPAYGAIPAQNNANNVAQPPPLYPIMMMNSVNGDPSFYVPSQKEADLVAAEKQPLLK